MFEREVGIFEQKKYFMVPGPFFSPPAHLHYNFFRPGTVPGCPPPLEPPTRDLSRNSNLGVVGSFQGVCRKNIMESNVKL